MMKFLPLAVFAALVAFFVAGLGLNARLVPSPLVGGAAPSFDLPALQTGQTDAARVTSEGLRGQVWVLNVWASWCEGCRVEHGVITRLASEGALLVGLNYKDVPQDAVAWLQEWGNPYALVAVDADGETGLEWGVYGVPETFVVDAAGVIVHKHVGVLDENDLRQTIRPLLARLQAEAGG